MSIMDKIKNHISDNRGKYGIATGIGAAAGADALSDSLPSDAKLMANKIAFNAMAKGQNLALDVADKIGYGKDQLQNIGLQNKIRPEDIQAGNELYDSGLGKFVNPSPVDIVNAAEHSSKTFNNVLEAKAQAQDVVQQAKAQFGNSINQGIDYVKGLNPFHESSENTINIPIKAMLLEGYSTEEIVEGTIRTNALKTFDSNQNYVLDGAGRVIGILPAGLIPSAGIGGAAGIIAPAIHYGIGRTGGKVSQYFSK